MAQKGLYMKQFRLGEYLDVVQGALGNTIGSEEFWPLKPAQMTAYFEDTLAVDIFKKTQILQEKNVDLETVASLFATPLILKNFLLNFASTGLKTANNVGWFKTTSREREDFFNYLFDVLEKLVKNDIFSRDQKQLLFSEEEIDKIPFSNFVKLDGLSRKLVSKFKVALFGTVWSLFFDTFYYVGFNPHGPYSVAGRKFKKGSILVINDYFNLKPKKTWQISSRIPFEKVRIYHIYKDLDWQINFFGRENAKSSLLSHLDYVLIEIDGNLIDDLISINQLSGKLFTIIEEQTKFVNGLSSLKQVKKAAEISYFGLRRIFEYFSEDWQPPQAINKVIEQFGDKFIKELTMTAQQRSKEEIRKIFDPRNSYI